ncbi:GNAT family N-acetyltransferase [uncultured Lacinutrix sp.]|uniref:GNAT family N-acetyltransferase n=1 Tax=uncultured Lacinutrix sp. TaxID=574032 RepID=UPI00262C4DC7|nr:GNAT family N-acetyltransferase [uncultured Lacinutrix sp.]
MRLIKPDFNLEIEYLKMLDEWKSTKEEMVPFSLTYNTSDFKKFVKTNEKHETNPENGFVCHTTFWLVNDTNEIIGTSNIRHKLNENLLIENGHIGYGIRPTFRGKGYATKILALSLEKAKELGLKKALLTCDKLNIASKKVILKNGGTLRREQVVNGKRILSFWISIN